MSVRLSMGFSCGCGDDFEKAESEVALIDEGSRGENRDKGARVVDLEMEFWPLEHPLEPQDEDRPVKCPMPAPSSIINMDGRVSENAMMKRSEEEEEEEGRSNKMVSALPPRIRAVRKRHHGLTHDDHHAVMKPVSRIPPQLPTHNITIYQMLHQFDKFDS